MSAPQTPRDDSAELAALYAAGALADDELAAVEAQLAAGSGPLVDEVRALAPVVCALAQSGPPVEPAASIRANLMRRVAAHKASQAARLPAGLFVRRAEEGPWESLGVAGVTQRVLFVDPVARRMTALVRMAPRTSFPGHPHPDVEECLVLEGDLRVGDLVLRAGDYQRAEAGSEHGEQSTEAGCLLLITAPVEEFSV